MPIASILLVDDAAETRSLVEKCFAESAAVMSTASPQEALSRAHELMPDVVLVGAHLRDMDLADFLGRLNRQQPRTPPVVILLTAKLLPADCYKSLGIAGTIAKPLDTAQLLHQVREIVG